MKAVILARVSTIRQEKEGLSIQEIQLPRLRTYCELLIVNIQKGRTATKKRLRKFKERLSNLAKQMKSIISLQNQYYL